MTATLFDAPKVRRPRWRGSRALVPLGELCPRGCGPLVSHSAIQCALFRDAGAGAAHRTTWWWCPACFTAGRTIVDDLNPRRV